jgi:oligopeptide/dipeptide ABC transporter ATP-binding protein
MDTLLRTSGLTHYFPITRGFLRHRAGWVRAVEDVDLHVDRGETLAVVGESGCGKTTLARLLVGLLRPTAGTITFGSTELSRLDEPALLPYRRRLQIVFQDPGAALNPKRRIRDLLVEPLEVHQLGTPRTRERMAADALEWVQLPGATLSMYPRQLSGGQRQRVNIARALVVRPEVIVLDEPTSALDVSVQTKILGLLKDLQRELRLTYVFITHNLVLLRAIATRVAVMYLGRIMEQGPVDVVLGRPRHPYTIALFASVPAVDDRDRPVPPGQVVLAGEPPSAARVPSGCPFHPRCYARVEGCDAVVPELLRVAPDHRVRCVLYDPARGAPGVAGFA